MIAKKDAETRWSGQESEAYKRAESIIDRAIERAEGYGRIVVDFAGDKVNRRVLDQLAAAYRACGWAVEIQNGDQRDPGPFFVLT